MCANLNDGFRVFVRRVAMCPKSNYMDVENNITEKTTTERVKDMGPIHDVEPVVEDVNTNGELMYILVIILLVCICWVILMHMS